MKANFKEGTKICSSPECKFVDQKQSIDNFHKNKSTNDKLDYYCKDCDKRYGVVSSEKIYEYNKKYYSDNEEREKKKSKQWYKRNKEHKKQYYQKNKEKINKQIKERRKLDPLIKLANNLRTRINRALKSKFWNKNNHLKEYLGCTLEELKLHLENQFTEGMTWQNHGNWHPEIKRWHIDHKIPLDSAKTREELYKLCHYKNLQPLWADDNLSKGKKLYE